MFNRCGGYFIVVLMTFAFTLEIVGTSPVANPSTISDSSKVIISSDDGTIKFRTNNQENVEENVIPSSEILGNVNERGEEYQEAQIDGEPNGGRFPEKHFVGKDSVVVEEKRNLQRFYKHVDRQRSVSPSDTIVFPSASSSAASSYNPSYDQSFSDIYNKNRPTQSPGPRGPLVSFQNYFYPTQRPEDIQSQRPRPQQQQQGGQTPSLFGYLTPEQDQLMYQTFIQIFRGLINPTLTFPSNNNNNNNRNKSIQQNAEQSVTIPIISETDAQPINENTDDQEEATTVMPVEYQSLYSGPRVQKSPCPAGQHKTPSGSCSEKSRKLTNYG